MRPPADASRSAQAGFAAFRIHCSRCHAVNGEGGGSARSSIAPRIRGPARRAVAARLDRRSEPDLGRARAWSRSTALPGPRRRARVDHRLSPDGDHRARARVSEPDVRGVLRERWQHPIALWLAALAGAASASRAAICTRARAAMRSRSPRSRCRDAWLTANHVFGIGALPARSRPGPALLRARGRLPYLLLWEAATPDGAIAITPERRCARGAAHRRSSRFSPSSPPRAAIPRVLFLVYELASARSPPRSCAGTRTRARCPGCAR
jgi:hypothetical protein